MGSVFLFCFARVCAYVCPNRDEWQGRCIFNSETANRKWVASPETFESTRIYVVNRMHLARNNLSSRQGRVAGAFSRRLIRRCRAILRAFIPFYYLRSGTNVIVKSRHVDRLIFRATCSRFRFRAYLPLFSFFRASPCRGNDSPSLFPSLSSPVTKR